VIRPIAQASWESGARACGATVSSLHAQDIGTLVLPGAVGQLPAIGFFKVPELY